MATPKSNKKYVSKKAIDYKTRYKVIADKVNFKLDLRKPIPRGYKGLITRLYQQVTVYKNSRFVPIKRKKKETLKNYKARIRSIKQAYGQDVPINGIFTDVPLNVKPSFNKYGQIVYRTPYFIETVIPADVFAIVVDSDLYCEEIWFENDFTYVFVNYSGHGRSLGYNKEGEDNEDPILEQFKEDIRLLVYKYKEKLQYVISGFILRKCFDETSDSCHRQ